MPKDRARAAGFVIFRKFAGEVQYLLLQTSKGVQHWTPPKGYLRSSESDMQAALRKTEEESGLTSQDFSIIEDCRIESKYEVKGQIKTVIYWLAELRDPNTPIVLSHGQLDYKWLPFPKACTQAGYSAMIAVLQESDEYIKNKIQ